MKKQINSEKLPLLLTFAKNLVPNLSSPDTVVTLSEKPKSTTRTVSLKTPDVELIGQETSLHKRTKNYLLLEIDPKKRKFTILNSGIPVNMDRKPKTQINFSENLVSNMSREEMGAMILEEVGTIKSKKLLSEKIRKNVVGSEIHAVHEMEEVFQETAARLQTTSNLEPKDDIFSQELLRKKEILPEFNYSASDISKFYNFHSILTDKDAELITTKALKQFRQDISNKKPWIPSYIKYHFSEESPGLVEFEQGNEWKAKGFYYLSLLLTISERKQYSRTITELAAEFKSPSPIIEGIFKKFFSQAPPVEGQSVKFIRSKLNDTRLNCHILVLALILNNFSMNSLPLTQNMKLSKAEYKVYFHEIGAVGKETGGDGAVRLTLKRKFVLGKEKAKTNKK